MEITHKEAHLLIQFNADHALPLAKRDQLASHLKHCRECSSYRQEIEAVGDTLHLAMRKQWSVQPRQLDVQAIKAKAQSSGLFSGFIPVRGAFVGLVVMLFVFASWQLVTRNNKSTGLGTQLAPIPTPSLRLTGTNTNLSHCQNIQYEVQQGDTLNSLAHQFSTSSEALMRLNKLPSGELRPGMKLLMFVCDPTPTGTSRTPTLTTTPMLDSITYTPG